MLGAIFSALGAVFRSLKTGLFIFRDGIDKSKGVLDVTSDAIVLAVAPVNQIMTAAVTPE